METIFTLPLSVFAAIQVLLSLLLLAPRAISLPISQLVSKNRSGTAAKSVLSTLLVLLLALFVSSMMELLKGADRVKRGDVRVDLMATVDFLRSQVGPSAGAWFTGKPQAPRPRLSEAPAPMAPRPLVQS